MGVKLDDAKIEVELDVRQALADLSEIESKLGQARARRRGRAPEVDTGRETRISDRRLAAAVGGAAATRGAVTAGGGLRRAVGFAAKVAGGITAVELIRNTPEIIRALLSDETLKSQLIDLIPLPDITLEALGLDDALQGTKVTDAIDGLGKRIAQIEATLKTSFEAAGTAYDLMRIGRIPEAGAAAIETIRRGLGGEPVDPEAAKALGIGKELLEFFDGIHAYNTAEARFRQRARGVQIQSTVNDLDNLFRAAGGGAGK